MMTNESIPMTQRSDADLVVESLDGGREAFRQIVERYQTLICSIAYSATGNLSRSQDLAQETFIAAWSQLRSLREPEKLRSWLCGIVRHRIHRSRRSDAHEPVRNAAPLDDARAAPANEPLPSEQAISREEAAILWRSLEKIPQAYREPLILFYREHQSIEHVAAALELSEDAVKQRLSRGRRMLQQEVVAFVEHTLRRTAPDRSCSGVVLMALPLMTGPTLPLVAGSLASASVTAKGTAAAKSSFLGVFLLPLAPFLGIIAGIAAQWLIIRGVTTDRRLRAKRIAQVIIGWTAYVGLAAAGETIVRWFAHSFDWTDAVRFVALVGYWWLFILATITLQLFVIRKVLLNARRREEAGAPVPSIAAPMRTRTLAAAVSGAYLAMFSWLIALAWGNNDSIAVVLAAAAMLMLGGWTFFRFRGAPPAAVGWGIAAHLTLAGAIILLILSLRADVWIAARYGVSVLEAQRVLPIWIVPLLSLVLVIWTALGIALTKRSEKPRGEALSR